MKTKMKALAPLTLTLMPMLLLAGGALPMPVRVEAAGPTCDGKPATLAQANGTLGNIPVFSGTDGNDVIVGTDANEWFVGKGGNDLICAGGGDDALYGGDGRDRLFGQVGDDYLVGGNGRDRCFGGQGYDEDGDDGSCEAARRIEEHYD